MNLTQSDKQQADFILSFINGCRDIAPKEMSRFRSWLKQSEIRTVHFLRPSDTFFAFKGEKICCDLEACKNPGFIESLRETSEGLAPSEKEVNDFISKLVKPGDTSYDDRIKSLDECANHYRDFVLTSAEYGGNIRKKDLEELLGSIYMAYKNQDCFLYAYNWQMDYRPVKLDIDLHVAVNMMNLLASGKGKILERVRICEGCSNLFIQNRDGLYCGQVCRNRARREKSLES